MRRIIDDGSDASDDEERQSSFLKSGEKRSATDFLVEVCFYEIPLLPSDSFIPL